MGGDGLTVISDNSVVAETLLEIAAMVSAAEAVIHPAARIIESEGDLRVECERVSEPTLLFRMPSAVLPDVALAQWKWSGNDLELSPSTEAGSSLQRELLDAHRRLYNATGKGRWFKEHHPRAVLVDHADVAAAVQRLKPNFAPDASAASFINTRVIRRPNGGDRADVSPSRVLMPLIDALNNHPAGAAFVVGQAVRVALAQPTQSDECYAFYGHRRSDPLSLALAYGYVDRNVVAAVSGPVAVEVPGIGRVEIDSAPPPGGSPLDPPKARRRTDGVTLSHLTFQQGQPQRLQVPVQMLLQTLGLPTEAAERQAKDLIWAVGTANVELLASMARAIESTRTVNDSPGLSLLATAGARQAAIIEATCAAL